MARLKKNTEEGKTGTFEAILKNSGEVVPTGIEPAYLFDLISIRYKESGFFLEQISRIPIPSGAF